MIKADYQNDEKCGTHFLNIDGRERDNDHDIEESHKVCKPSKISIDYFQSQDEINDEVFDSSLHVEFG